MKHRSTKKLIQKLMAASVAAVSTAAFAPFTANADCLGQNSFDNGIILPWTVFAHNPAEQDFEVKDGSFNITIINPGGKKRGGESRWDLGIRHRNLHIEQGHKYKVHWELEASAEGELHTHIAGNDDNGEGVWQNNSGSWNQGWNNVKIEKGENSFDSEFTATKTIEVASWEFHYGGEGSYQAQDCFPEGTVLKFDNLTLECEDCGEEYKNANSTPCLWDPSNEMGIITPRSDVRVNQIGYYTLLDKKATYATSKEITEPVSFTVKKNGEPVFTGKGTPIGYDEAAGDYCQILDFSTVTDPGTYTIEVDDKDNVFTNPITGEVYNKYISHEFRIGNDVYKGILTDAMNYYYQSRSDEDITEDKITSFNPKDIKAKLAHAAQHKSYTAYIQSQWIRAYGNEFDGDKRNSIDAAGGWYTGSDNTKNVIVGANSVWLLQNMYEMEKSKGDASEEALREARYELEWMFKMIVDPENDPVWGKNCANFVYHQANDHKRISFEGKTYIYDEDYMPTHIVRPPTYAATFNMIACAAQAARLWEGIDDEFAHECLQHAEDSWKAVMAYKEKWDTDLGQYERDPQFAPESSYVGTGIYEDRSVKDEAYWAACELFATTGAEEYYNELKDYKNENHGSGHGKAFDIDMPENMYGFTFSAFNNSETTTLGTLSLYLSDKISAKDKKTIEKNITSAADEFIAAENSSDNGMGLPYKLHESHDVISMPGPLMPDGYEPASNAFVTNNAMIMAYAYDASNCNSKYLNGMTQAMDYIFGRNGLGISYVTGYGSYHSNNPSHRFWIYELDSSFPMAPSGIMVSGPCSGLQDDYVKSIGMKPGKVPAQKCYADSVASWSTNDLAPDWQASFAWNISFVESALNTPGPLPPITTTSTSTSTTTTTTTTTTSTTSAVPPVTTSTQEIVPTKKGDTNCDDTVELADAILIMQSLANPNKYGVGGSDTHALTEQGRANADVDKSVKGLTSGDALRIQEYLLHLADSLD